QFSLPLVQQAVQDAVGQLLAFDNVDFGQTVFISKVYEVIQEIDGVLGVTIWTFGRQKTFDPKNPIQDNGQLVLDAALGEIPTWTGFTIADDSTTLPLVNPDGTSHLEMRTNKA